MSLIRSYEHVRKDDMSVELVSYERRWGKNCIKTAVLYYIERIDNFHLNPNGKILSSEEQRLKKYWTRENNCVD